MITIFEKKIGYKTLVITDMNNQINKIKPVTTDKGFIDFVEQLEITQLDLESYSQIKKMANTKNIREIEMRLLEDVRKQWAKIVIKEKLDDSFSMCCYSQ